MTTIVAFVIVASLALTMPKPAVAFTLGVLLPIDVFANVSPLLLDATRYSLALVLIVRSTGQLTIRSSRSAFAVLVVLLTLATVTVSRSIFELNGPDATSSYIAIVSALVAYAVARLGYLHRPILLGFTLGALASATDIILQVLGLPYLGSPAAPPYNRYSGFSFSSTSVAPFLAVAIVVILVPLISKQGSNVLLGEIKNGVLRPLSLVAGSTLLFGLIVSGGRGGLAGLALALVLLALNRRYQRPLVVLTLVVVLISFLAIKFGDIVEFLNRGGASASGFATGRVELNEQAWEAVLAGGLWGPSSTVADSLRPHTPILTFGVSTGIIGAILIVALIAIISRLAVSGIRPDTTLLEYNLIAAIILIISLLEPTGFFVGLSRTIILMIALTCPEVSKFTTPSGLTRPKSTRVAGAAQPLKRAL